ncbi:MAG: TonB-dependent receptor, partial [Rubricoccaceae bacterium]|nr:TonB-dependent receptor [Rubricoccaceae bacterium]
TAYADNELYNLDDCAGLPRLQSCVRGADPSTVKQWSQEVHVASTGDARINWLSGAYFFTDESYSHFFQTLPRLNPQPLNDQISTSADTVYALFGQATLHFNEQWGVTGGLRYSDEHSEISNIGIGVRDNHDLVELENDWNNLSWRADLEYKAHENLLVYGGISTGFKSGGVRTTLLPEGSYDSFEPEDLLAYETGIKGQWPEWGLAVDASAFYYDFDDLQVSSVYVFEDRVIGEVENASGAEVYGLDIAGNLQMTERLQLSGGVVWLPKREFVDYTSPRTGQDLSGNKLSRAPEWSGVVSLVYSLALAGQGELSTRIEYAYRSKFYYTKENLESESQGAHGLWSLFLRYEPAEGSWYAFATGRNLTDEDYFHQVFLQSTPGYPDTYEVGLGFRF